MFGSSISFHPDQDIPRLTGKVIIVTGGNAGLGFETIRQLAKHDPARIYLAARSKERSDAAIKRINEEHGFTTESSPLSFLNLNLASFESIKSAVRTLHSLERRVDLLINNAGITMVEDGLTEEGYEIQFGTNQMGPALLTQLLLPMMKATLDISPDVRVVTVSSQASQIAPDDVYNFDELKTTMANRSKWSRYCLSKLANIHYTTELANRNEGVQFVAVDPGMVATNIQNNVSGFFLKMLVSTVMTTFGASLERGAHNQIWAAVSADVRSGECYAPVGQVWKLSALCKNRVLSAQLYEWAERELERHFHL